MSNSTFFLPPQPAANITIPNPYHHPIHDYDPLIDNHLINYHQLHLDAQQPYVSSLFGAQELISTGSSGSSFEGIPMDNHMLAEECKKGKERAKGESHVIAIRTQTQLETLDDGFKWKKYGKKMVKSNPNPRHYYKCSIGGCNVKKTVERDGEDSSYLITTYDGRHNHESPCVVYCDRLPILMVRPSQSY